MTGHFCYTELVITSHQSYLHQENSTLVEHIEKLESDRNPRLTEARKHQTRRVILTHQQVRLELVKHRLALGTPVCPRSDKEITSPLRELNPG